MPKSGQKVRITVDRNEIGTGGKITAGILLALFTVLPICFLIGLWPDQMPQTGESEMYSGPLFHIRRNSAGTMHINTIMFLLTALAGFTGSMIHLATSFTNYVGSGKFQRSWILWYCVKPFTAAAVALIFFLVLKAGLLNFDGAGGANPFGIVILSALAGLFTDKATLKLEEIFTVIFKPKDERPDKIDEISIRIKGFDPKKLKIDGDNQVTITGEGLDKQPLSVMIQDQLVTGAVIEAGQISFAFKIPESLQSEPKLNLSILDEKGAVLFSGEFETDGTPAPHKPAEQTNAEVNSATARSNVPAGETDDASNTDNLLDDEEEELAGAEQFVKG